MTRPTTSTRRTTRRPVLLSIMALGAVVTLTAVNGVFAVFTDRATTGTNSVESRAEARSADIQIATADFDGNDNTFDCGTWVEDLTTGIITATDMEPGGSGTRGFLCLRNVGSRSVDLTLSAIDLVDTDDDCTGDEAAVDATCGDGGPDGELSQVLQVFMFQFDCDGQGSSLGNSGLGTLTSTPFALPSLTAGSRMCFEFEVDDQASGTGDMITITQSDTTTWKFAFDATAT